MELEEFVTARLNSPGQRVSRDDLSDLWASLFPDTFNSRQARSVFLSSVEAGLGADPADGLEFRAGGWEIDLSRAATKTIVATSFLGGLLAMLGTAQLPAAVATAVIPLLFDGRRVKLKASEHEILADLTGNTDNAEGRTASELYEALTPDIRAELSRLEFADFLDSCRRAGLIDENADGTIRVRPADQARFRITLK
jgi:hypothetical protein